MEELQRLSAGCCENESVIDIPSLDLENLHVKGFEFPTTFSDDALTDNNIFNSTGNAKSLNLAWLNELTLFGDSSKPFGSIAYGDDEIVSAKQHITSDREDFAAGLNISPSINNWCTSSHKKVHESPTDFNESRAAYSNNVSIKGGDSDFNIPKLLDLEWATSPKRRKLTEKTFKRMNESDRVVEAVDGTDDHDVKWKTRKNRFLESTHFEMRKCEGRSPIREVGCLINTEKYFSDRELMTLSTKELNRRVQSLPKPVVDEIKTRRRTLKNRGYAQSCRDKKNCETNKLKEVKKDLEKELSTKQLQLELMKLERDEWKQKYLKLALTFEKLNRH